MCKTMSSGKMSVVMLGLLVLTGQWFLSVQAATLSLRGNSIPTDGSGRIVITDINPDGNPYNYEDALNCQSELPISENGNWFLHPTQLTTDESIRIQSFYDPRGWHRKRDLIDGHRLVRLIRLDSIYIYSEGNDRALEGVFTCDIPGDSNTPVSVGIYYPIVSVDITLNLISASDGTFSLTCIASGGTAISSSFTGPGLNSELQPVGSIGRTGQNTYSATTDVITTAKSGDVFTCNATTGLGTTSNTYTITMAGPPTDVAVELTSPTTIRVTWRPPTQGATVTGYIIHYTDRDGERTYTTVADSDELTIDHCGENVNISIAALSQHLPSEPQTIHLTLPQPSSVAIHPMSATAVRVSWSGNENISTALQYRSHFTETGAMISQRDTDIAANVTSTDITLDDTVPGYQHSFSLHHVISCAGRVAPVTTSSFTFDKKYFQIQFGPTDYCLYWGVESSDRIEVQLHGHITRIIRERCLNCTEFSESFLRRGSFLCHGNPTTVTYRSTLVNPSPTTHPSSTHMVGIIQNWVSTAPSLTLDWLLVRVNADCPTGLASLGDTECEGGQSVLPNSALVERVSRVINVCAIRQLGRDFCSL